MRWMWIDRIVEFEPNQRLVAIKNVSLAEEHLHDHFAAGDGLPALPLMPATLLIEGMAQTAGILVGSVGGFKEKVILGKITTARFDADVVPGQTVRYEARLERIDAQGASTRVRRRDKHIEMGSWSGRGRVRARCARSADGYPLGLLQRDLRVASGHHAAQAFAPGHLAGAGEFDTPSGSDWRWSMPSGLCSRINSRPTRSARYWQRSGIQTCSSPPQFVSVAGTEAAASRPAVWA